MLVPSATVLMDTLETGTSGSVPGTSGLMLRYAMWGGCIRISLDQHYEGGPTLLALEGARASTGLCVDVSSGVII